MIYFNDTELTIQGYKKILKVSEDEITFIIFKKTIIVTGNNLSIPFFENDEFKIKGLINNIQIYDN